MPEPTEQQQQQFSADFFKPESEAPQDNLAPKPQTPQQPPAVEQQQQPQAQAPQGDAEYEVFAKGFQKYFGVEPQAFAGYFQEIQTDYHTRVEEQYKNALRSKFGEDGFDQRYEAVNKRFNALPPERQQALLSIGNVEAAILIDNAIRAEQAATGSSPAVPSLDGNSSSGANPKREWRMSEIYRMTPKQFKEHEAEIDQAAAEGRLIRDA